MNDLVLLASHHGVRWLHPGVLSWMLASFVLVDKSKAHDEIVRGIEGISFTLEGGGWDVSDLYMEIAEVAFEGGARDVGFKGVLVREPQRLVRGEEWNQIAMQQQSMAIALNVAARMGGRPVDWRDGVLWVKVSNYEREDVGGLNEFETPDFGFITPSHFRITEFLGISDYSSREIVEALARVDVNLTEDDVREVPGNEEIPLRIRGAVLRTMDLSDDDFSVLKDIEFLLRENFDLQLRAVVE